ncbi:putative cyclic nucleotide-gated ion channel 15 [Iris pallida]|uniref:Cyclic nucleotide-gated ion channel 15 n=1 Tax=Iris pallida TaxID=29817 RepID=A0AAX6FT63_IRIPA|nr:putative cyclic nucleotide-gated ion channel 15 [Iris pallida]
MACSGSRSARFSDEVELEIHTGRPNRSFKNRVLSRVFSEDYESARVERRRRIFDPRGPLVHRWNRVLLAACLVSLFVDPLFFYLHGTAPRGDVHCIRISAPLEAALTAVRSVADAFYATQIFFRFRTAFVAPSSRVFGRGELVIDPSKIAARYLSRGFWLDFVAALPLTQFLIWVVIPNLDGSITTNTKNVLRFTIIFQYLPRMFLMFPLSSQIVKTSGVLTETNWAGAAFNLILYMLVSHIVGASWYLLSIERQEACWREACRLEMPQCQYRYLDCNSIDDSRNLWFRSSNLTELCKPRSGFYKFGIYADAVDSNLTSAPFFHKYLYCFWWGLKNLSSLGQNFETSMFAGENVFAIVVAILGLVLFGLLIGNMQSYLQSTVVRLEEWRNKRTDTEQWMKHRQLPLELKQCVRRYDQYKWVATQGVDEEALLRGLPLDLRRDIKRHLCIDLIRRVPLFDQMDGRMLDAICERLRPVLYTSDTCLIRELDQVSEMLFIIRGHLDSNTTNGGRTGFFNSCRIGPGDFCGEELLTWALDARSSTAATLPSSTRTVRAVTEVEAFALVAEDLQFVAAQFRRLHSKRIRDKFRFYSQHWRTWAACFIQAAWRRHRRKRLSVESSKPPDPAAGAAVFVGRLVGSMRQTSEHRAMDTVGIGKLLRKPTDPDFSEDEEN